ncbi:MULTISPECIES: hypothetical protein [unclassified Microbacterium]|uniref:hypothetical protein n=1 Tax=unclassified Microbacterium TaxID=2609290 RepID=UPI00301807AB
MSANRSLRKTKSVGPWKGGWLSLLVAIGLPFLVALIEIFWLGPSLLRVIGADGSQESARDGLVAMIVVTGVLVALIGATLRTVAHGRNDRQSKNFDLSGKVLAVAATVLALVGAAQYFAPAVAGSLQPLIYVCVATLTLLFVLYGLYWLVLDRLTRPTKHSAAQSDTDT